jgi:hypothetical protein
MVTDLFGPDGEFVSKGDTEMDRIINSFYCGQIQALHYVIYFLFRSPRKYSIEDILRYIEGRYCCLIKE